MEHVRLNGSNLLKIVKVGRDNFYHLENGVVLRTAKEIEKTEVRCSACGKYRRIKKLHRISLEKAMKCPDCVGETTKLRQIGSRHSEETKKKQSLAKIGKNLGPDNYFYGKHHSEETKEKIRNGLKGKFSGDRNPFYGKKHPKELMDKIVASGKKTVSKRTPDKKAEISLKISLSQKEQQKRNPEKYFSDKRRAARISNSNPAKYSKNKIEKIVERELIIRNLNFEYSVILDFRQYDFGCKKYRILLEVQGDYWHGNPEIYTEFNYTQIKNKTKDILKYEFAEKHGMKIFYIWEKEILNNNFTILDEIKEYINGLQANSNS